MPSTARQGAASTPLCLNFISRKTYTTVSTGAGQPQNRRQTFSEPFSAKRGFRQDDYLPCYFCNLILEKKIKPAELNRQGTIFTVQLLAYSEDFVIIDLNNRALSSVSSKRGEWVR